MIFALFLLSVIVTLLINPDTATFIWTNATDILGNPMYIFWLCSFSVFMFSGCVEDVEKLSETMEKMAYTTIGLNLLHYVVALAKNHYPEYMTFSYNILFSTTLMIILTMQRFSWPRAIAGVVGAVLIFIAGCRGALVGLLVSVFAYDLLGRKHRTIKWMISRAMLAGLAVLLVINWNMMLMLVASLLESLDISSRTIYMLLEENILDDSGRSALQNKIWQEMTVLGHGLYADRITLDGTYAHNILLELLFDYGILFGSVLSVLWISVIITGVMKSSMEYRHLICALLSVGCIKLFLSGSFLNQEPGVYLLLGLCMNGLVVKKDNCKRKGSVY